MAEKVLGKKDGKVITQCAFCQGEGRDPFGLLSPLSLCQVCKGSGEVAIREPAIECAFCYGSGVHRGQRVTCTVCRGKGMVHIEELTETCPNCNGEGVPPGDYLPCVECKGIGVVTAKKGERAKEGQRRRLSEK